MAALLRADANFADYLAPALDLGVYLARKRLRRGVFKSVPELIAAIQEFIRINNQNPKPFVWTKKVEQILEKVGLCKAVTVTLH